MLAKKQKLIICLSETIYEVGTPPPKTQKKGEICLTTPKNEHIFFADIIFRLTKYKIARQVFYHYASIHEAQHE